nr:PREDICTED: T-lymphoma invasion and metastasis-inducing protein 2-like [Paralichthys olivaceus]
MGNTDSHSSFVSAAKPSCSLRSSSRREEVPSARSWRSSQGGCKSRGRSCQNQNSSWRYEHGPRGGSRLRAASLESGGSPKVLLSKDGSMRVEFTNSKVVPMEPQGLTGLPTIATTAASSVAESPLRTSKGSSLSSDGSWYDSPWGGSAELADNVFVCGQMVDNSTYSSTRTEVSSTGVFNTFFSAQVEDISPGFNSTLLFPVAVTDGFSSSTGYNTCSSGRTEDSGIGDSVILQPDLTDFSLVSSPAASLDSISSSHNTLPAFPTAPDPPRTASSSTLLDDIIQEEDGAGGGVEQRFSSLTLPCRRAESISTAPATGNNRKDFLKSRIRRLSDWTGSLNRKKRRIQEPSDVFINGLNCELVGRSVASTSDLLRSHCGSRGLNQSSDAQRQNIYENFMQELETSCSDAVDRAELSEEEEEQEEEMDGEVELGGIEQLDSLFEKEQGVVRRAGWLFFKALITVNKDRKLELVSRRRWRHYWVTLKGTPATSTTKNLTT